MFGVDTKHRFILDKSQQQKKNQNGVTIGKKIYSSELSIET